MFNKHMLVFFLIHTAIQAAIQVDLNFLPINIFLIGEILVVILIPIISEDIWQYFQWKHEQPMLSMYLCIYMYSMYKFRSIFGIFIVTIFLLSVLVLYTDD